MIKILALALVLLAPLACTDKQKILSGNEFPFHDGSGEVETLTITPTTMRNLTYEIPRGDGDYLHLGTYDGFEGSFAIRFPVDSVTNFTVDSCWLWLAVHRIYPRIPGEMRVRIFEIEQYWREDENPSPADLQIGAVPVSDTTITTTLTDTLFDLIPLSSEVVQRWADQPATNNGIYVTFSGATILKEYYTYTSQPIETPEEQGQTSLRVVIHGDNNVLDVKTAVANNDITFLSGGPAFPDDRMTVDNIKAKNILIRFETDTLLPREVFINDATIVLNIDKSSSLYRFDNDVAIVGHPVTSGDWLEGENPVFRDSTTFYGLFNGEQVVMNVGEAVQLWGAGYEPNYGFIIRSAFEGNDFQRYSFYSTDADTALVPKLYIRYTLPVRRY